MATLSQRRKPIHISTVFEIGIFEPDVDDPLDDQDWVKINNLSVYRDVDAFCQHVEDVISVIGPETVRDNLHFCLRGAACRWWYSELLEINKQAIRDDKTPWLCQWIGRLQDRFRQCAGHPVAHGLRRYYTSDLIVDDPHPVGEPRQSVEIDKRPPARDVITCVDAPAQALIKPDLDDCPFAEDVDDCHPAEDVSTSIDAFDQHAFAFADGFCLHAERDLIADDCHSPGDILTSVDTPARAVFETDLIVNNHYPADNIDNCYPPPAGNVITSIDVVALPSDM
jgi:hypothetical protein